MPLVYLALGSNLGDRLANLRKALALLEANYPVKRRRISPIYENRAVGMGEADDFLNAVVEIETSLEPEALLDACLEVEQSLGRKREGGWAPRTIDLDLLLYEGFCCKTARLNLPHPRIAERDFVAIPLGELYPEGEIMGQTIEEIIENLPANELRRTDYELV